MKELKRAIEPVKNTRLPTRGDLFVHLNVERQKNLLLSYDGCVFDQIKIRVAKTNAETKKKGVIFNVPVSEDDARILNLLKEQGVREAFRVEKKTGAAKEKIRTGTWILAFEGTVF